MSHNWQDVLISPTATMGDTISVIDKGAMQLALVVDEQRVLLGVVTDGDIRRALIRHQDLSTPISEVMNKAPLVANIDTSRNKLLSLMNNQGLGAIPLISEGKIVGLETLQHIIKKPSYDNPVFLMAGGFGTRLKPLTDNCPKPLLKLGDKPILETILNSFIASGFHQFYISTHYMPEAIKNHFGDGSKWGVKIHYVHEQAPLGTGGSLGLLPENLPNLPIIMMNGDVLTKIDFEQLLNYHNQYDPICTMCVREEEYKIPYGVVEAEGSKIISLVEKPTHKYFINAGVYVVSRAMINAVNKNQRVDMTDLIENYIANKEFVAMFPVHEYWLDIGKMVDFYQAQKDVMQGGKFYG
ncbi:nucleotidyltransferase family protein [Thalassotalea sp. PP2-459]|uniref:nucleotidyltransferase family protein n=1 Tax=Thalassotalea sp. PP2-459 TaxID=1742724 RepID=UPI0009424ECE|nr:nucleotidyltransferase family protein [Thalassotalea sp. PP2-459]OKY24700.1 alcohol dehydrogenase [Thalassotalea sp. PP2-459]